MRRFAAHFIRYKKEYRLHYIEVDENGLFQGVYPLQEEISETQFLNGILVPVPLPENYNSDIMLNDWKEVTGHLEIGFPVRIYHLDKGSCVEIPHK